MDEGLSDSVPVKVREPNLLTVTNVSDCNTPEQLMQRIVEFVTFMVRKEGKPPKLNTINKRFGMRAAKLGTSSRELVGEALTLGLLKAFNHDRATVLIDCELLRMQEEMLTPIEIDTALQRILSRAE